MGGRGAPCTEVRARAVFAAWRALQPSASPLLGGHTEGVPSVVRHRHPRKEDREDARVTKSIRGAESNISPKQDHASLMDRGFLR